MTTNMEELEKKTGIEIEGVKAMMVDGFSRVDQKLTAIEELLKKVVETQNHIGKPLEKRNENVPEKNMGEGGVESSIKQDDGNMVTIRGGGGGPLHESQEINDHIGGAQGLYPGDQGRQGLPWDACSSSRWVGLYTQSYGKNSPEGTGFTWAGRSESDFRQKDRTPFGRFHEGAGKGQFVNNFVKHTLGNHRGSGLEGFGNRVAETVETGCVEKKSENDIEKGCSSLDKYAVKTGQDEILKDCSKSSGWETKESLVGSSDKEVDKTDATEDKEEEQSSLLSDDKTDASLQESLKQSEINGNMAVSMEPDEGRDWSKMIEEKTVSEHRWGEKGPNSPLAQASEGSNEKGHEESQKPGSSGSKEEGLGFKRKHPDSPVEGRNDSLKSGVPLTATRRNLNIFTTEEQEILDEIEPIMQSIQRIMNQAGYNDGDPLSADDQTYILDNVLNHHPGKAQKLGAGFDYIMINQYKNVRGSRCFHIVSTDGRKEDFSYLKCLKNFVTAKYPDKADKFVPKYFKNLEPRRPWKWKRGPGPDKAGGPCSWSGWNHDRESFKNFEPRRSWKWVRGSGQDVAPLADVNRITSPAMTAGQLLPVGAKKKKRGRIGKWQPKLAP